MKKLHARKGGFTLIELMIVVAIIGILAAIAIPNFIRFQLKAKSSEGKTNLAAIRTAEQSYYSEFGMFVGTVAASPNVAPTSSKQPFGTPDAGLDTIGWAPEGQVYFNYMVGIGGGDLSGGVLAGGGGTAFLASAEANIDANTIPQVWGYHKPVLAADGTTVVTAATPGTHPGSGVCTVGASNLNVNNQVAPCDNGATPPVFGQSEF